MLMPRKVSHQNFFLQKNNEGVCQREREDGGNDVENKVSKKKIKQLGDEGDELRRMSLKQVGERMR